MRPMGMRPRTRQMGTWDEVGGGIKIDHDLQYNSAGLRATMSSMASVCSATSRMLKESFTKQKDTISDTSTKEL